MNEEIKKKKGGFLKGLLTGALAAVLVLGFLYCKEEGVFLRLLYAEEGNRVSLTDEATLRKLKELEDIINYIYLDEVDNEKVQEWMYRGIMAGIGDDYADYYTENELTSLIDSTSGTYEGIGAVMSQNMQTGVISVVKCYEGTPAEESGLLPGDMILSVNGKDAVEMGLTAMVLEIKTGESSEIEMVVQREGEEGTVTLKMTRRVINIPTVSYEMLDEEIGYIVINEFDDITVSQFAEAKQALFDQDMQKMIVDLRNNPGGTLASVVQILNDMLPKGMIVYTEDRYGSRSEYECDGADELDIPLAVLINEESASASEIFAGAVKDHGIGTLVGTTTFGKGIVQRIAQLSDGTAVKLTISRYFTPNGNNIHETGIEPDVVVELDEEVKQLITIPKEDDNQLQKAIEVLEAE